MINGKEQKSQDGTRIGICVISWLVLLKPFGSGYMLACVRLHTILHARAWARVLACFKYTILKARAWARVLACLFIHDPEGARLGARACLCVYTRS